VSVALEPNLPKPDYRFIYCLLDLHYASGNPAYLQAAARIAEAVIHDRFHEGWFVSSERRNVNSPEALAVLRLGATLLGRETELSSCFW
jgi:hypothetical protein